MPKRFHLISLVPLGFAVLEIIWMFGVVIMIAAAKGKLSQTRAQTHTLDVIGMLPAVAGVVAALVITFRCPNTVIDRVVVGVGLLACAAMIIPFARELMTP